jgi:chromate reductase
MYRMDSDAPFRIVGLAGSLRRGSLNRLLLQAAVSLAPARLRIDVHEIADIPFYNQDTDGQPGPEPVAKLRQAVREADGLLLATPEYNYGVPGVLKNTIDWLSRPARASALNHKPAAIMGASSGLSGTARSQAQLRQAFVFTNTYAMLQPELLVRQAQEKFDADGQLTDETTRTHLTQFLEQYVVWIQRVRG